MECLSSLLKTMYTFRTVVMCCAGLKTTNLRTENIKVHFTGPIVEDINTVYSLTRILGV